MYLLQACKQILALAVLPSTSSTSSTSSSSSAISSPSSSSSATSSSSSVQSNVEFLQAVSRPHTAPRSTLCLSCTSIFNSSFQRQHFKKENILHIIFLYAYVCFSQTLFCYLIVFRPLICEYLAVIGNGGWCRLNDAPAFKFLFFFFMKLSVLSK